MVTSFRLIRISLSFIWQLPWNVSKKNLKWKRLRTKEMCMFRLSASYVTDIIDEIIEKSCVSKVKSTAIDDDAEVKKGYETEQQLQIIESYDDETINENVIFDSEEDNQSIDLSEGFESDSGESVNKCASLEGEGTLEEKFEKLITTAGTGQTKVVDEDVSLQTGTTPKSSTGSTFENNEIATVSLVGSNESKNVRAELVLRGDFYTDELLRRKGFTLRVYGKTHELVNLCLTNVSDKCKLLCNGLPRQLKEIELMPLFEKFGKVYRLAVNQSDVFVTYTNVWDAEIAIKTIHHSVVQGRFITVKKLMPDGQLLLKNIPNSTKSEIFRKFGSFTRGLLKVSLYTWFLFSRLRRPSDG